MTDEEKEEVRERLERAAESRNEMWDFLGEAESKLGIEIETADLLDREFGDVGEVEGLLEHLMEEGDE
jgi:hypothetical protein